jgi:uncharacterized protein YbaP (TraB family)
VPQQFGFTWAKPRSSTIRKRSRRLAGALALAAMVAGAWPATVSAIPATAPVQAPAQPGPALWVVSDADTVIYLFGTFHALDGRSQWFNRSIKAAFDASDLLVLETLVPEDPAELHAVLSRNSLLEEPRVGDPVISPDRAPSFVASAGQAMSAGRSMGMSVDQGADAVLRRAANAVGKPVDGLETFDFQLRMFGSLPPPPSRAKGSPVAGTMGDMLSYMQSAWARGDSATFASVLGNVRMQSPAAYKTLFADRNAHWASWIAQRMQQPGTVFVAVGTGHLIGHDSVQAKLAERGIQSARIS